MKRRPIHVTRAMALAALLWVASIGATAGGVRAFSIEEDAEAFGTHPAVWNPRLSPSGEKLVYVRMHASDRPMAGLIDFEQRSLTSPVASRKGGTDLQSCGWATEKRLVCRFLGADEQAQGVAHEGHGVA